MMLQAVNNSQPSFGMAFKPPKTTSGAQQLAEYVGIGKRYFAERGLKKFAEKQAKNTCDIVFNEGRNSFEVYNGIYFLREFKIKTSANKTQTDRPIGKTLRLICKAIYLGIVKPDTLLPKTLKEAGAFATERTRALEAVAKRAEKNIGDEIIKTSQKEKAGKILEDILNEAYK